MKMSSCTAASLLMAALPMLSADRLIVQRDRSFSQTEIAIQLGETLTFKNADEVTHNVFSVSPGMEFDLRRQGPGESTPVKFAREGTAEVRCSIHPKMKVIVTVRK